MKTAFLFPGQGAQTVGMGMDIAQAYPAAEKLFDRAKEILGYDLKKICFHGSAEKLNSTTICQPGIFVTSAAILEVLRTDGPLSEVVPEVTAGLSLGEYTALYAGGAISFDDAVVLVQQRGSAMQQAAEETDGAMVSIIGLDEQKVEQICERAGAGALLKAVNFNCNGQIVVSGDADACSRAAALAEEAGAIKAVKLQVAGAFHTEMMFSAAEKLEKALVQCTIADLDGTRVIANINAEYYNTAVGIRDGLVKQLIEPILWQKCMERLIADGVEKFYEIGPNRVLTGLMRRINRKIRVTNISTLQAIQSL